MAKAASRTSFLATSRRKTSRERPLASSRFTATTCTGQKAPARHRIENKVPAELQDGPKSPVINCGPTAAATSINGALMAKPNRNPVLAPARNGAGFPVDAAKTGRATRPTTLDVKSVMAISVVSALEY